MRKTTGSQAREFTRDNERWRAVSAWCAGSGDYLLYLLPLTADGPAPDDRRDRRARLSSGESLAGLPEARLVDLLEDGAALTETERRITDVRGRPWLAQATGPAWADAGVAEGLTGVLFTLLDGTSRRVRVRDGGLARLPEADLKAALQEALEKAGGELAE
ncbi:MAG: hypothetical protein ACE5HQ_05420 [Gemmatimonadota bacterium]